MMDSLDPGSLTHLAHSPLPASELAARFTDLAPPLTPRQAAIESARCLYCYDAPCTRSCPTGIDVASFIRQIHEHNLQGAAHKILSQNIFGGACARVCPTEILCEDACVRNHDQEGQPVRIGLLQRYALDHAGFAAHPFKRAPATGRQVAVVGAGPAGLACAHRLAMLGHEVVVFESRPRPGGLNEYGIARYKLPGDFAQREVAFLLEIGGIDIRHGYTLGQNLHLENLHAQYDAVFLAVGLSASRALGLTGEHAPGLVAATQYIAALRQAGDLAALPVPRRAIVLGAGNTAIDMAVQIRRLGAEEVTLVYRRGADSMSATHHEQHIALLDQVRIRTWAAPREVMLDAGGRVRGMRFEATHLKDGRLQGTGDTFELAADAVFKAIGQALDPLGLADPLAQGVARAGDKIQVDGAFRTSVPGVYAGGDCVAPGQDLTVQAVQHGKLAALAIHHDLKAGV
ncbi:MAG: NAD(P)-dependent oxidoreductase [Gammaproteobacteria bacterium]